MGGRGGGSGRGSSALDTKDVGELRQYMQDHYSVTVHSSADKVDFGVLRSAAGELEGLLKEFPQAAIAVGQAPAVVPQAAIGIHELNGSESRSNAYASASLSGKLQLNPKMMGDQVKLDQSYENDVRVKWHPDGTSSVHIASHEIGHLLESALVFKNITQTGYYGTMDRINAWNKHRFATKVVGEAARAAKKTAAGKGLTNDQLVAQISRYATKNRSEAMAEAVADYRANGSRAKPLSQAIWKILKRELG